MIQGCTRPYFKFFAGKCIFHAQWLKQAPAQENDNFDFTFRSSEHSSDIFFVSDMFIFLLDSRDVGECRRADLMMMVW